MASLEEAKTCFDSLLPEILVCIVKKLISDSPSSLEKIAQVNKAFREAAQHCSQLLIVRAVAKKTDEGPSACEALSKAMSLRPNLSNLVVERGAQQALWPPLAALQWASGEVAGVEKLDKALELFRSSVYSLKRLHLEHGGSNKYRDEEVRFEEEIHSIVKALPKLETFTLQVAEETFLMSSRKELEVAQNNLAKLEFSDSAVFWAWSDPFRRLATILTALTSLSYRCHTAPIPFTQRPLFTSLQVLRVEVLTRSATIPGKMLRRMAAQCPNLQQLTVYVTPDDFNDYTSPNPEAIQLPNFAQLCPSLEYVAISQIEVLLEVQIDDVVSTNSHLSHERFDRWDKILVVKQTSAVQRRSETSLCSIDMFWIVVAHSAPIIEWDQPDISERLLGEAATVERWCRAFSKVSVGKNERKLSVIDELHDSRRRLEKYFRAHFV